MDGRLTCWTETRDRAVIVHVEGALDLATVPVVRRQVHKCLTDQPDVVVVNLTEVGVGRTVALTALPALARTAWQVAGARLVVSAGDPHLRGLLRRHLMVPAVPVCGSVDEALAVPSPASKPRRVRRRLAAGRPAAQLARYTTDAACRRWRLGWLADRAATIVTELIAYATSRGADDLVLHVGAVGQNLVVALGLEPTNRPAPAAAPLAMVSALADGSGLIPRHRGEVVWARLDTRPPPPPSPPAHNRESTG